jgi:polygalacturonase
MNPKTSVVKSTSWLSIVCASVAITCGALKAQSDKTEPGWSQMDEIVKRVVAPSFPAKDFPLSDYGAVADGKTDSRPAIVKAIDACNAAGGGRVVVPAGKFFSKGPIHLKSNVNLHLSDGATIIFSPNAEDYLPAVLTRWEGTLLYNYSPLIYAKGQTNIAVTGKGTIEGNGVAGMGGQFLKGGAERPDRDLIRKMGAEQVPVEKRVFGAGHYLRPSAISPYECTNVLIEGVTIHDLPFWGVHPVFCRNVTVKGIHVDSHITNNDGCDPDSCTDVLIEDCHFETGDDAVAIKSGRDQDGWAVNRATENVVVRNCLAANKFYALCIGSEMSGGVRNVYMENCRVVDGRAAVYIKANLDRGGVVENVYVRHVLAEHVTEALVRFETGYHGYRGENHPPVFQNFVMEDLQCRKSDAYAIYAEGVPASLIRNVTLRRVVTDEAAVPTWLRYIENFTFESVQVNDDGLPENPQPTPETEEKLPLKL